MLAINYLAQHVFFIKLSHKYVFSRVFVHLSIYYALSNFLNLFLGRSDGLGVKFLFSGLSSCFLDLEDENKSFFLFVCFVKGNFIAKVETQLKDKSVEGTH